MNSYEVGKWIVFAGLCGAVFVGFKTRTLRWYEFLVCGLFVLLADALVFHGTIVDWVGQIGSTAQNAANGAALGMALLGPRDKRARLGWQISHVWQHRPGIGDVLLAGLATWFAHRMGIPALTSGLVFSGLLTVLTVAETVDCRRRDAKVAKAVRGDG